jgi:hypothetical protein
MVHMQQGVNRDRVPAGDSLPVCINSLLKVVHAEFGGQRSQPNCIEQEHIMNYTSSRVGCNATAASDPRRAGFCI